MQLHGELAFTSEVRLIDVGASRSYLAAAAEEATRRDRIGIVLVTKSHSEHYLPTQVESQAEHRPPRIHEHRGQSEIRTELIVGREAFRGCVVQQIEHVQEQLNATQPTNGNCSGHAQSSSVCDASRRDPRGSSRMR